MLNFVAKYLANLGITSVSQTVLIFAPVFLNVVSSFEHIHSYGQMGSQIELKEKFISLEEVKLKDSDDLYYASHFAREEYEKNRESYLDNLSRSIDYYNKSDKAYVDHMIAKIGIKTTIPKRVARKPATETTKALAKAISKSNATERPTARSAATPSGLIEAALNPSLTDVFLNLDPDVEELVIEDSIEPAEEFVAIAENLVVNDDSTEVSDTGNDDGDEVDESEGETISASDPPANKFLQVVTGGTFACTLKLDGSVWCWGDDDFGQLGNNADLVDSPTPVRVNLPGKAEFIDAGYLHACAVLSGGQLYCWGNNSLGHIGDGTTTLRPTPVFVQSNMKTVAAGTNGTCGLSTIGVATCWGFGGFGGIGNGVFVDELSPVAVTHPGGVPFSKLISNGSHFCSITDNAEQRLYCWGYNNSSQLGDGTTAHSATLIDTGMTNTSDVANTWYHTCALNNLGEMFCWGRNDESQSSTTSIANPITVPELVAAALPVDTSLSMARHTSCYDDGTGIYCLGRDVSGELGNDLAFLSSDTFVQVEGTDANTAASTGGKIITTAPSGTPVTL